MSTDTMAEKAEHADHADGAIDHLSRAERVAVGRSAREAVPRGSHASWEPQPDRRDPVELLEEQAATRVAELVPIRYGRMLTSPFAFYRGAALLMAADLAGTPRTALKVQLCGDAHLSNFGGFEAPDRQLVFSVNDFDETLPGPFEWDLKRLVASCAVAGRASGFSPKERERGEPGRRPLVSRSDERLRSDASTRHLVRAPRRRRVQTGMGRRRDQGREEASRTRPREITHQGQHEGLRQAHPPRRR